MAELLAALVPEVLGLVVTPVAVIACLVLLGSPHPYRNVAVFAVVFVGVYAVLAFGLLVAGRSATTPPEDATTVRGGMSAVLGVLFLLLGIVVLARHPDPALRQEAPVWTGRLVDPTPRLVATLGLVLAVTNPNVAILASGLGIVLTADVPEQAQVAAVVVLLAAATVDFVVPSAAFAASGPRGRAWLRDGTAWLVGHDRAVGAGALVVLGLLFSLRGLVLLVS